jgi:hydrogenase maturation protease
MTSPSIAIIGVGNPLRKDDGIGIALLHHLKKEVKLFPNSLCFIDGGTGGMNLLHICNKYDVVIILDAVDFKGNPGETRFFSIDEIKSNKQVSSVSTHHEDLFKIIRIGQELGECPEKVFIFGVQPAEIGFGEGLTEQINVKIKDIIISMKKNILRLTKQIDKKGFQ